MSTVHEMFKAKADKILEAAPPERRAEISGALEAAFQRARGLTDRAEIGVLVGPLLKRIELEYAAPRAPKPTRDDQLLALRAARILDDVRLAELRALLGEPGVGKAIDAASGQLSVAGTSPEAVVIGYTMIEGFMFERSRARIAQRLGYTEGKGKKVRVSFVGVKDGAPTTFENIAIDNDVPLVPDHIWETKYYTRRDYGAALEDMNQLLKYQAAINAGHFESATLEVYGNIAPDFLRRLIDCAELVPGLLLDIPDVEVLYALDEHTAVPIRRNRRRSLARGSTADTLAVVRALAHKRYEVFAGALLTEEDVKDDAALQMAAKDGKLDPRNILDVQAFRRFEQRLKEKRRKALDT
ncbi:hypothetical protein Rctr197k_219 [Virus Rctr197k]|nr:hypothetical protein Rctr197k_219 [Virus Rctr197k]